MNYKLPRPIFHEQLFHLVAKEIRKQRIHLLRPTQKQLKDMAEISRTLVKEGIPPYLIRKKLPGSLGFGIFLHPEAVPLKKGQILASYSGEVFLAQQNAPNDSSYAFEPLSRILLTHQEQSHFDSASRYHPRRFYALYIDAFKKGNFTRFINHSERPNVVAELFRIPKNTHGLDPSPIEVIYLVKKAIKPGEQLLVCYEGEDKSYWKALKIKPTLMTPTTFYLDSSFRLCS